MKRIVLALVLISLSSVVYSQDYSNRGDGNKIIRGPYETNSFFDNWVVGVGTGVNIFQGNSDSHQKLGKRMSMALDLSVAKWITPGLGFRVQYSGLKAKGSTSFKSDYATTSLDDDFYKEEFNILNLHGDVLWNLSNSVSGYREDRLWDVIPYVGVGLVRSWNGTSDKDEYATSIGVLNSVRLNDLFDLTLEGRYMLSSNRLDLVDCGSKYDRMTSITVGVSFKLGKRNFKRVTTPDYSSYDNRIVALETQNKQLKTESTDLSKELDELNSREQEIVEIVKQEILVSTTPVALFFKLGKSTLDKKELANLDFYVKNAINVDNSKTFTIIGTADSATGTNFINQHLSERRMECVYNILVTKYGVSPDRLIKKAEGSSNDRFESPELNRTVIIQ